MIWLTLGAACLASCADGEKTPDPALKSLLVPLFDTGLTDGAEPPFVGDRDYNIDAAIAFTSGSWDAPEFRLHESIQVFGDADAALNAYSEGRILGRLSRTIDRTPIGIDGAVDAVIVCVDQVDYGSSVCDFPLVLVLVDNVVVSVSGGTDVLREELAGMAVRSIRSGWAESCTRPGDIPDWC